MDKVRQFIKDYTRGCSNELGAVEYKDGRKVISYHEWLTPEQALAAVEIARQELIDKAMVWLTSNMKWGVVSWDDKEQCVWDFKKAMEK